MTQGPNNTLLLVKWVVYSHDIPIKLFVKSHIKAVYSTQ